MFERLTEDLSIISGLPEKPNASAGYTSAEVQAAFDAAGLAIQSYINDTFLPQIEEDGATNIGIDAIAGLTATSVQEALEAILAVAKNAQMGSLTAGVVRGSVTLGTNSIISAGSVGTRDIGNNQVTYDKLATDAVRLATMTSTNGILPAANGGTGANNVVDAWNTAASSSNKIMRLPSGCYGTTLPSSGVAGQIYFKKV